jgi:GNAT superfamily N-acetyltransferase
VHAAYLRHLGSTPIADVLERDGIYAVRTGVASNTENGVVGSDTAVSAEAVRDVIAWFDERRLPASWLVPEGDGRAATAATLEAAGCRPERSGWEMRAPLERLTMAPGTGVGVRHVDAASDLETWLDVAGACGWFESEDERRAWNELQLGLAVGGSGPTRLYVAFRDEHPVGMASAFFDGEVALLNAVAVVEPERRRGVGRALATERLREARDRGCTLAVLDPSPDGAKLYESLGFESHRQPPDRWFYLPTADGSAQ